MELEIEDEIEEEYITNENKSENLKAKEKDEINNKINEIEEISLKINETQINQIELNNPKSSLQENFDSFMKMRKVK